MYESQETIVSLETLSRAEIGQKLFRTVASRSNLVQYSTTYLKLQGTEALARLQFRMNEIVGQTVSNTSCGNNAGDIGERHYVFNMNKGNR